ncbi:MAG: hypothetical protein CVV51_05825 [Spirochaetae bacterium HGW-Spirochaetae-7]|jgi:flavodoxin|nr:MAG: hypothetical protein CVV51_05825 [Spirochaetae bacterium HGW-Spirochaetae-7]
MKTTMTAIKPYPAALFALVALAVLIGCSSAPAEGAGTDASSGASKAGANMPSITQDMAPVRGAGTVLVVYFSQGSATKRVAEDLAALLGADIERIVEQKSRTGFFGFMGAGADSSLGKSTRIDTPVHDPVAYDAVVVCTPVWSWHLSPPVRTWLGLFKGKLPPRSVFVTVSGDTEPEKIVAMMEEASGAKPVAYAGFADRDFEQVNREAYLGKIRGLVTGLN